MHDAHPAAIVGLCHVDATLISSATDGSVSCWDIETGARLAALSRHAPTVHCLLPLPLPSGEGDVPPPYRLVAGDGAGLLKLWTLERSDWLAASSGHSASAAGTPGAPPAPAEGVAAIRACVHAAWHAAGKRGEDNEREVSLLEFLAEQPLAESAAGMRAVHGLALGSHNRLVAAAGATVTVWDLADTGKATPRSTIRGIPAVTALAVNDTGVFAGSAEGDIHALQWKL